jgi:DNA-binding MarR family transcriptional regulator
MKNPGYFTILDNEILRSGILKPHDLAVYANIKSRQGNKSTAWPSLTRIAMETSMSVSGVKIALKRLSVLGLVVVRPKFGPDGKRGTNVYRVTPYFRGHLVTVDKLPSDYKEDSLQEETMKNSSAKPSRRDWRFLNPNLPATHEQLDYLYDLIDEHGEPEEIFDESDKMQYEDLNQVEADGWIKKYYAYQKRQDLCG